MTQREIKNAAILFAKRNKLKIAKEITDIKTYTPSEMPVSIFMAGSPGAGKTEFSKGLLKALLKLFGEKSPKAIRIDGDELRNYFPGYTGKNSKLFQGAMSILVEKAHDLALKNKQNFILDGTFWKQDKAMENINRSLAKKRLVLVFYIYQPPKVAWDFTKKRELLEGRNIPKSAFIEQFIGARKTIEDVRLKYGEEVVIYFVEKNYEKNTIEQFTEINTGQSVDQYISSIYTKSALNKIL